MSTLEMSSERATQIYSGETVDMKLEVVVIPVSDVDRAKRFYGGLGWRLDADFTNGADWRVVQMTPPGSPCSIHFGKGITTAAPGSVKNLYLVVSDIEEARGALIDGGADVSDAFHFTVPGGAHASGPAPNGASYSTFASFNDPDSNSWLLQEIKTRIPGRGVSNSDVATMIELLREAEEGHGRYEPTAPKHHWSDWYAAYIIARERGATPEDATKSASFHLENIHR